MSSSRQSSRAEDAAAVSAAAAGNVAAASTYATNTAKSVTIENTKANAANTVNAAAAVSGRIGNMMNSSGVKDAVRTRAAHIPLVRLPSLLLISVVYIGIFLYVFVIYDTTTTSYLARILTAGYDLCTNVKDISTEDAFQIYRTHWRENRWKVILRKMGLFLFIFASLFAFLLGIVYVFIMKGTQHREAAFVIGVCLATILGSTFLIIDNQYFVTIFENTVGYQLLSSFKHTRDTLQEVCKHKSSDGQPSDRMFPGIRMVMTFMLSVFYMNNFGFVLQQIGSKDSTFDFTLADDEDPLKHKHIEDLAKCVVRKHTIGQLCWLYFASVVATIISTKYLAKIS